MTTFRRRADRVLALARRERVPVYVVLGNRREPRPAVAKLCPLDEDEAEGPWHD